MFKRMATAALVGSLAFTVAACSSNSDNKESAGPSASSPASSASASPAASENADLLKSQAYIAARIAEEKVDSLFHEVTSKDEKPILNPAVADRDAAAKFLSSYMDPALANKVLAHYLTEEKADDHIVVKSDKFFSGSIRETASKDDVTIEGTADEFKITTKTGGVFTVKKNADGKYVVTDYAKNG